MGLSATQFGMAMGARVIAVDIAAERRQLAKAFGAETVIDPREVDAVAALRELTRAEGVEAALEIHCITAFPAGVAPPGVPQGRSNK